MDIVKTNLKKNNLKTAIEQAILKIDEQIEIAQVSRVEASKIKGATSMNRHHGMKIALVCIRQVLVNLLEMEKQQIIDSFNKGFITDQWDKSKENKAEQYYNETFKNTKR